ncbi:hypothetical protein PLICRDRAFT_614127 [Plicaturopsis crispa FD-325 SS-3]|nr:hypothetical protein PLICRDRAFT_614127 [Plicaturopsis crispa FD-325 SS-3]
MASSEPPWRIKTKPCPFYSKGRCLFSDSCNFLHNVKATTSADAFAAAYADHENTSISSYTLPHKEMDNVPLVTVNSPASSFRSSPRSPRMSGLLMALGDVISSDEEDEEEEDELHSAVENSETLVEDGEESTMVEGFSSFLEHYGRRHSTESTDSVLGVSSSVFDSEDDDETTNSIIFPAADENDAPDSANSDTLFPSHDDDDDTTQYYTALYSPLFSGPTAYTSEEAEPVDTVHPVLEPIAEHGPSSPVGNEHAYAEFLSPVEMSPAPLRNFSRDYCESGLRREDSIDSGYADSWTGPTPFRMSPPTQNPHRSSTFDLLASPFGSPAVRILSPRLGAFHVQSHPPPFFTPITGAAPGNSADGENVTPTPGSGKQYSDLDSDLGEPEHYSLESEDGGEDSSQEDDTVTTLAEASNASVHELDTNQAVENSVDHVSPETFDAGVVVAGGPAHSLSEPSDPPVAANAKSLFDDSGIEISPDTSDNRAAGYTSDDNPHLSRFIFPSDRVIQNYDSAVSVDPLDVGIATDASTAIPDKSHPPLHHNDDPSTEDFEDDVLDSSVAQDASFDENDTNMDVSRLLLPASRVDADESMEEYEGDVTANSFDNTMTTDASADDDTDPDLSRLLFPLPPTSHSQGSPSSMTSSARHLSYEVMTAALVKRERAVSELTISAVTDDGSEPSMPTMLEMIVDEEAPNSPELLSSADPTIRQADFSASSPRDERDTLVSLYTSYSDLEEEDEEDEKEADPDDTFHCADANKVQATPAHESVDLVDSAISHLAHPTDDSVDPDESFHSEDATDKFSRALSELSQRLSKGAGGLAFLDSGREESPRLQSSPPSRPRSRQSRKSSTSTSIPAYPPYVASRDPNLTLEAEDAGAVESKGSSNESYDIRPRSLQSRRSSPSTSAAYPSYVASHDPDLTLEAEDTEAVEPEGSSNESYDILNSIFDGNDSPVAQPDVSVVVSPDQRRTPNPSVFSPESTAGARTPLLPSTSRAPSPTVTPGSARARVFTPPPFNRERSGTIVPTPTEQHRRLHSAGSSGDHERVFTPPPLPRGRTGTIIATESNSSRPVSLASPRTPLSASSRGRSPITAAAPAKSPVDSEPSTKVPFGFRRSTTFGHVQNSPLLSNRSSQSIPPSSSRTRPAVATDFSPSTRSRASSPLNPSTTSRSGSPSNGNTHESHRPHSPSTSAARRLKPLRLSSILDSSSPSSQSAFVTASSPMLSSRPSSISYKPGMG